MCSVSREDHPCLGLLPGRSVKQSYLLTCSRGLLGTYWASPEYLVNESQSYFARAMYCCAFFVHINISFLCCSDLCVLIVVRQAVSIHVSLFKIMEMKGSFEYAGHLAMQCSMVSFSVGQCLQNGRMVLLSCPFCLFLLLLLVFYVLCFEMVSASKAN